jgi:alpha-N-arabinofuranosidase
VTIEARGFDNLAVAEALQLRDDDLGAVNSKAAPDRIKPAPLDGVISEGGKISLRLAPASWNLIALAARPKP